MYKRQAIGAALRELEAAGYIVRHKLRDRQGRISDTAVSYTHLDVYKRQGYHPCDIGILTCAFESRRGTLLGGQFDWGGRLLKSCLLYTSRCV